MSETSEWSQRPDLPCPGSKMPGTAAWKSYEEVARHLLEQMGDVLGLGLERVEGKQKLVGKSGVTWEIEGKGVRADDGAIVVIECRRYTTSKLKQAAMGELAYRIGDLGASGGIVVTPIGVQQGGEIIAKYEGVEIVHLDENSTTTDYVLRYLTNLFVGVTERLAVTEDVTFTLTRSDDSQT